VTRRAVAASNSPRSGTGSACRAALGPIGVSPPHGVGSSPFTLASWLGQTLDHDDVGIPDRPRARRADAGRLSEVVTGHRMGALTVRWIHLQVLRELAQHSGHADILREQLLAARGRPGTRRTAATG